MVKSNRLFVSAALAAVSLLATAPVLANEHGGCDRHHAGKVGHHGKHAFHSGLKKLDLTDAQRAQVKDIMEKQKPQREARWKELRESSKALREASRGDSYDAAKVKELASRQAQLKAEMMVQRIETMHQVYALLTPEQKQKWDAKRERHHDVEKS